MKSFFKILGITAVISVLMIESAMAQDIGGSVLRTFSENMVQGSIGTFVGLAIALFGLWVWLVRQETWGVMIIIGGVLITIFPGVFDTIADGAQSVLNPLSDEQVDRGQNANVNATSN